MHTTYVRLRFFYFYYFKQNNKYRVMGSNALIGRLFNNNSPKITANPKRSVSSIP